MADELNNLDPKFIKAYTDSALMAGKATEQIKKELIEINRIQKESNALLSDYSSKGYDILSNLRKRAKIQQDIKKDTKAYSEYLKEVREIDSDIANIEAEILKLKIQGLTNESEEIKYLNKKTKELREQRNLIASELKSARGFKTIMAGIGADIAKVNKGFKSVKAGLNKVYDFFDVGAMFKMLKSIKTTNAEMGLIGTRSLALSGNIQRASMNAATFGVSLEDVAKIQGAYSDELGTTDFLSEKTLGNFAALGKVTGMGAEAVGKMAAEMKSVGMSSEKTAEFMEQSFQDAASMGLNATKVMRNFSQNLKMLNKYNFKGGAKSLMRMAESATKMGVGLNFAAPMAEKLFDIEGAVEMSAQLQVMGGEWAKLGDPFKLMYMARNDMEGLTNSIINATKGAAKFNEKTGEFDIAALDMQKLRKIAEATGLNFEELAESAKKAAQFAAIKKQVKISVDPKTEEFIENTAFLDEKGKAQIMVGMDKKYVDTLSEQDKKTIIEQMAQKKSIQDRARETQTFDEKLKDLIVMLKTMALPIIETINNILAPKLDGIMEKLKDPEFIAKIAQFAKTVGEKLPKFVDAVVDFGKSILHFVKNVGKFILEFPKTSLAIAGGIGLAIGGLKWLFYGMQLGNGFNITARAGAAGAGAAGAGAGAFGTTAGAGVGANFNAALGSKILKLGGVVAGLTTAYTSYQSNKASGMGTKENLGRSGLKGVGAGFGAWGGAAAGAAFGSVVPIVGTIIGGLIGGALGAWGGGALGGKAGDALYGKTKMNDGVVFNAKDKFTKVNDGMMVAGTEIGGNKKLAQTLSSMAPAFSNKKGLMPGTRSASSNSSAPVTINHKHDDMKIDGTITITTANGISADLADDLLKSAKFVRSISKMVNVETARNSNYGVTSGNV